MPLPLLHAAAGYAVYHTGKRENTDWNLAASCIVLANLPDLDFIPGILVGHPDLFHHSFTHSYTMAAAVGLSAALLAKAWKNRPFLKTFLLSFFSYASHVLLDSFFDNGSMPLFWPLTSAKITARAQAFNAENIHLGNFDNFFCDRFLSLGCIQRFSSEIMAIALACLCFFVYSKLKNLKYSSAQNTLR